MHKDVSVFIEGTKVFSRNSHYHSLMEAKVLSFGQDISIPVTKRFPSFPIPAFVI